MGGKRRKQTQTKKQLSEQGRKAALATIVQIRGSVPSFQAAKMLIRDDGSTMGSVGGGCAVPHAACFAVRFLHVNSRAASPMRVPAAADQEAFDPMRRLVGKSRTVQNS